VVADHLTHLIRGHLEERPITGAWPGDHHVVDRVRHAIEELLERSRIGCVEVRDAARLYVRRRLLEALAIAAGQHDLSTLGASSPGGFEPDAGAAADQDDGLAEQLGLALRASHPDELAICAAIGWIGGGMSASSMRSAITAGS
jgi:hypothetical protein